jgi:hypothetical protein
MLNFVIVVFALLGVAATSILGGQGANRTRVISDNVGGRIASQARVIAAELSACTVNYPTGVNGTAYRATYPAALTATAVTSLTCPGKPAGYTALFATLGAAGVPSVLNGFGTWLFVNDATSARLTLTANSIDGAGPLAYAAATLGASAAVASTTLTFTIQQ